MRNFCFSQLADTIKDSIRCKRSQKCDLGVFVALLQYSIDRTHEGKSNCFHSHILPTFAHSPAQYAHWTSLADRPMSSWNELLEPLIDREELCFEIPDRPSAFHTEKKSDSWLPENSMASYWGRLRQFMDISENTEQQDDSQSAEWYGRN